LGSVASLIDDRSRLLDVLSRFWSDLDKTLWLIAGFLETYAESATANKLQMMISTIVEVLFEFESVEQRAALQER
jgi:hypothetical protein